MKKHVVGEKRVGVERETRRGWVWVEDGDAVVVEVWGWVGTMLVNGPGGLSAMWLLRLGDGREECPQRLGGRRSA